MAKKARRPASPASARRQPPGTEPPDKGVFAIRGRVTADDQPVPKLIVAAFAPQLRQPVLVDQSRTDDGGRYEIQCRREQFTRSARETANVIVRVFRKDITTKPLAEVRAPITMGADAVVDVRLTMPATSEWEHIVTAVRPLLKEHGAKGQPLEAWQLEDQEIEIVATETGLDLGWIRSWAQAARWVHEQRVPTAGSTDTDLYTMAGYAWLRTDPIRRLDDLRGQHTDDILAALNSAAAQALVPSLDRSASERLRAIVDASRIDDALRPASKGVAATIGDALRMIPDARRLGLQAMDGLGRQLMPLALEAMHGDESALERIREVVLDDELLVSVQRSLRLKTLTGGHAPLMQALQRHDGGAGAATLEDLVSMDLADWTVLVDAHGVPPDIDAPSDAARRRIYARQLLRGVQRLHPTGVLRQRITANRIRIDDDLKSTVDTFLAANPKLRFKETPLLVYLASNAVNEAGLTRRQIATLTPTLLALERVARVAPSVDDVGPLMSAGYRSARDIVRRHSRDVFVDEISPGIDPDDAARIYDTAAGVVAATEGLVLMRSPLFAGRNLPVLPPFTTQNAVATRSAAAAGIVQPANLQQLFGNQDYCECGHGASLYGPAAYLADLLQMLDRGPKVSNRTALQVLLERRPDLAELDLTGDNADITLPYIDLVLEVLEAPAWEAGIGFRVLRGGTPQNPTNAFDTNLDQGNVPGPLADDLATWSLVLSDHRTASRGADVQNSGGATFNSWLIRDQQSGMKLRLLGVIPGAYRIRAYPQSVAGGAGEYRPWSRLLSSTAKSVSSARFPWKLPFDIARDEANTWLVDLGATREAAMVAFAGDTRWSDVDAACERLNIGRGERGVLLTPPGAATPAYGDWGFENATVGAEGIVDPIAGSSGTFDPVLGRVRWDGPGTARTDPPEWYALLRNVSLLRARARLTHRELLNVLETRFVRANGARLDITGDECNAALMRLEMMNAALARRIHLFVRLWRVLGWSILDVDRAIISHATHTAGADPSVVFTDALLLFLANIARLHTATGVAVAHLVDVFGTPTLDTAWSWDHSGAQPVRTLSRYQLWFDNPTLGKPRVREFRLNAAGTALEAASRPASGLPGVRISDQLTYVAAAVGLAETEFTSLIATGVASVLPIQAGTATVTGAAIDLDNASITVVEILTGAISNGATFAVLVEHSNDNQTFAALPDAELGTTNPIAITATTGLLTRYTYTGTRRFLRTTISSTAGATPSLWIATRILTSAGSISDELSLANLSTLCRCGVLRRMCGMPIADVRTLMTLSGMNPLASTAGPETALGLMAGRDALATIGLSIADADRLLGGPSGSAFDESERRAEALLTTSRSEFRAIVDESTVAPDQRSALLVKVLTGLGWNEQLIATVVGATVLGETWGDYEAPLDPMPALPGGVTLPAAITYNTVTKRLTAPSATRPSALRVSLATILTQVTGTLFGALTAIDTEAASRETVLVTAQAMLRAIRLPTVRQSLGTTALTFDIPAEWRGRFFHDRATNDLCFVGWMTQAERDALKALAGTPPVVTGFPAAIDNLYNTSKGYTPAASNTLVVREGAPAGLAIEVLLLDTTGLQDRSDLILQRLLPLWRNERLHAALNAALVQALDCTTETADALLRLNAAPAASDDVAARLTAPTLLDSDPATRPTRAAFPQPFDAAARVIVLGTLAESLPADSPPVSWLGGLWTGLDLTSSPTTRIGAPAAGAWSSLIALSNLLTLRTMLRSGVPAIARVLTIAQQASIDYAQLADALECSEATLRIVAGSDGLNIVNAAWLRQPSRLLQLAICLELSRTLNLPASVLVRLTRVQAAQRPAAEAEAEVQALRQAAIGASDDRRWSDTEDEVADQIRHRRRDATVEYLVQKLQLRDANDLYGYYLIDPSMGPCMMTSRIVQAISSVQLFVQRCLLRLEPDAPPSSIDREQWSWMKNYRVWEANRKVLLYPENWIEPELRDDKTPFFDELISSLQQGDATGDKAELAVQTFLEKLTDFSRMEIVATCTAYDDANRLVVTHIFARTLSEPHAYFYREFRNLDPKDLGNSLGVWTSWQAIALDIEGHHLFPFVWQGRLFLFWAILTTESDEPSASDLQQGQTSPVPPRKFWRLKIAWSEYKSGAWTGRRMAQDGLSNTRLDAAKPTPNIRTAAAATNFFYFVVSVRDEGVTITANYNNDYYSEYQPFATLLFDGQRVVRADGTYVPVGSTYGMTQTASQAAEVPIDGTAPARIPFHNRMAIGWGFHAPVALQTLPSGTLPMFASTPRAVRLLFSTQTTVAPFSAPSVTSTLPVPAGRRTIPFFVSDQQHRFFMYPITRTQGNIESPGLHVYALDWLQAARLRRTLSLRGVDGLLSVASQDPATYPPSPYFDDYQPVASTIAFAPDGDLEYSLHSATSTYNFELFFHAPFAIACALSKNQRFEDARRWFHFIFDPTDASADPSPARYWRFRPFREWQGLDLSELVRRLADPMDNSTEKLEFKSVIAQWKDQPFKPHLVARMRLRSYMYVVVMKYVENLIDWADQLFRRDTRESISEATQLYILAAQILGRRPEGIPRRTRPVIKAYTELAAAQPDDLTNALIEAENLIPEAPTGSGSPSPSHLQSLYFCLPNNPKLAEYVDRVEDKLFKLRNCMNIDGVVRDLALFEPPIDPALLVKATAAGIDVGAALADARAPLPLYRFTVMAQKATELCGEVKAFGGALLAAIEKGDAEALALMRSGHDQEMLRGLRAVKETQLLEAKTNIDAIGVSLQSAQTRFTHYIGLVSQLGAMSIPSGPVVGPTLERLGAVALETVSSASGFAQSVTGMVDPIAGKTMEVVRQMMTRTADALSASLPAESMDTALVPLNAAEKRQLNELKSAHDLQQKAADQRLVGQVLAMIPDFTLGAQGFASSPVVQFQIGGTLLSKVANIAASITDSKANEHTYRANLHNMLAGYQRRASEWMLQAQLAAWEIAQLGEQLKAGTLRVAIASRELANHDRQAAHAREQNQFMRDKFTNQELFTWMSGQLATRHFQAYQLAYDVAKRAERCFMHELGVETTFISFGYWDSLKKGLLAGEALTSDLKRMEVAYLNQNARDLEITKHISLRELDPVALVQLQATGRCEFNVPEVLFDLDFPGHYFRRIKSVSVSLPCIVGPYTSVSGTLTLLSSKLRAKTTIAQNSYTHDDNYRVSYMPAQSIATSTAQNDPGMFELNFRDDRYLPFEGAGAISQWRFELPADFRAFDYSTISDVVLHLRYTARDAGGTLKVAAAGSLQSAINTIVAAGGSTGFARMISLRHEFPSEWQRLVTRVDGNGNATEPFALTKSRFPFLVAHRAITVAKVDLYAVPKASNAADLSGLAVTLPSAAQPVTMRNAATIGRFAGRTFDANVTSSHVEADSKWNFEVPAANVMTFRATIDDILMVCHYTVGNPS